MSLRNTQMDYKNEIINKQDYVNKMHEIHKLLFEYADFIKETDINKIEITDDFVVMTTRTTGAKFICDKNDKRIIPIEILNFGFYEKTDFDMVLKLIEEKFNVFDIGANIGGYTINISKVIKDVKVFSFEPVPKTFEYLKRNIEINNILNAQIYDFGFSNEEKELNFHYYPEGSGNAFIANLSGNETIQKISCRVKKLDDFVSANNLKVDFIKCDVEGAELFVFQGGIKTIEVNKPIIFTEMLRKWSMHFNYHPNDIIKLLNDLGYRCFTAKGEYLVEFFKMDENTVETNFFFLHSIKHIAKVNQLIASGCP